MRNQVPEKFTRENEIVPTRLVMFEGGVKVDFAFYGLHVLHELADSDELDAGFKVLLDKDGMTRRLKPPTFGKLTHAKPTEDDYRKAEERCRADKNFDQYSVAASLRGYRDQAVTLEQMSAVKVPTLGIVGTLDHTLKEMQDLRQARPGMKFVLLEGVSHTGPTGIQRQPRW